jgi:poly [ADP-ribose] polymerase
MKIKTQKHYSDDPGSYTETLEFSILNCTNIQGNNLKFYSIELQTDGTDYQVFTNYGRIGGTSAYDIRNKYQDDTNITESDARKEYNRLIKRKLKGKKRDGYIENYEVVEVLTPTVGSKNIKNVTVSKITTSDSDIKNEYSDMSNEVQQLINQICEENIHNITSVMDLNITSNGLETPLGKLSKSQIDKAKSPLTKLNDILKSSNPNISDIRNLSTLFYSLVPHRLGHRITDNDLLNTNTIINDKFDLLDMLESAVDMGDALQSNATKRYNAIGTDIKVLTDPNEIKRIEDYVYNTKASNHRYSDIYDLKIKRIYVVHLPQERKRFESQSIGNVKELFHGSRNCNILSILKNGLIIVKSGSTKTGEMFGPGIYFADSSTKSANYSYGFWGGIKNKYPNNFMFLADVSLGTIEKHTSSHWCTTPKHGYDSVMGVKGNSLYNNEYIVYNPNRCTLKYLIEFEV